MLKLETADAGAKDQDASKDSSARFHEQYFLTNFEKDQQAASLLKVADQPTRAADQPGKTAGDEQSTDGGGGIEALRKADPESLSKNMRAMQGLVENFATADNKSKALEQFRGAFDKNIKQNDDDFQALSEKWKTDAPPLQAKFEAEVTRIKDTQAKLNEVASKIPAEDQSRMQQIVHLWSADKNSPELKHALEKEMDHNPGFLKAVKDNYAAITEAPTVVKVQEMRTEIAQAATDRVESRMIYAEVLAAGGDQIGAKRMMMQSMGIQMNVPPEQVEELLKRQQSKDK